MTGGYIMKEKNIQELAIRMGLITVEDMCQYTIAQLVVKIANKVNGLVDEVWRFETDVQEILKTQNENIQYLLGEGLLLEVENIFDGWIQDGTFDTLLNQSALKKVNDRIDETNAQLSDVINSLNQFYKASVGVNIWYRSGSSDNYRDEVIDDMVNLGIKQLIIPCHNEIIGDDTNGFTYIKDLTQEKIELLINKARAKGVEEIIIKLHRTGLNATSSVKWLEMWEELVHEYTAICVKNNIKSLVFVNEQRNATNGNKTIWTRIINHVKSNGLTAICSLADFTEVDSCAILDLVDVIGVNHYPAVVSVGESVTQSELNRRIFQFSLPKFRKLKLKYPNKPIWITEIGCTRNVDSLSSPASWEFDTTAQSMIPQSQFVEAVFSIFACFDEGLIDSVNWWSSDAKDKINTFTFFGNELAEKNFKKYMRGE